MMLLCKSKIIINLKLINFINMKRTFLWAVVALFAINTFAQEKKVMQVWSGNAIINETKVSEIDSIVFADEQIQASPDFLMYVEDVFTITGRGTVLTGKVILGSIDDGAVVRAVPVDPSVITEEYPVIGGIEMYRKPYPSAVAGDNIGIIIGDVDKKGFPRGTALVAKAGSLYKPCHKIKVDMHVLSEDEGGRHTPFFAGYRPKLHIGPTDITVELTNIGEGGTIENGCKPGDDITGAEFTIDTEGYQMVVYLGQELVIRQSDQTIATLTVKGFE